MYALILISVITGFFYFTLGNLHPKLRSKYRAIQLVALCNTSYIDKYSMNAVLQPFVDDLKRLVITLIHSVKHLCFNFVNSLGDWVCQFATSRGDATCVWDAGSLFSRQPCQLRIRGFQEGFDCSQILSTLYGNF